MGVFRGRGSGYSLNLTGAPVPQNLLCAWLGLWPPSGRDLPASHRHHQGRCCTLPALRLSLYLLVIHSQHHEVGPPWSWPALRGQGWHYENTPLPPTLDPRT